MFPVLVTLLALALTYATALESLDKFSEGSCSRNQLGEITYNREVINSFRYFTGMNKFNLYFGAALMPNYASMREDELYYDGCYSRNSSTTPAENAFGGTFGFGRPLVIYRITARPGIYFEGTPTDPNLAFSETTIVTLTDNKSFVVLVNCWNGLDQRGWVVLSRTPYLDSETQRIVEEHALSLGFKSENFAFLRHDSCRLGHGNPALGID